MWGGSRYPWSSWQIIVLFAPALCGLVLFVIRERRATEPILSLGLFKNKAFTISVAVMFLTMIGLYGSLLYIPLFAQDVIGVTATNSGLILVPMMIGMIAASVSAGQIVSRTGRYRLITIISMIMTAVGMVLFIGIGPDTTNSALSWRMVLLGVGLGIGLPIFTTVAQSAFGPERLGEVTAGTQLFRNVGGTFSTAFLGGTLSFRSWTAFH